MRPAALFCLLACAELGASLKAPGSMVRLSRPAITCQRVAFMTVEEEEEVEELEAMSEEEYLAELAAQPDKTDPAEMSAEAKKVYRGMRSETGVEFAPWMKVDPEAIAAAKKAREERKKKSANTQRVDGMSVDPQAAELGAGGGLRSKVLSEEEVELRWSTGDETGNSGFIVQRRPGGSNTFDQVASFEDFAPLRTKGAAGGDYVYLDDTIPNPGTFVYRILDCDGRGERSAICQMLVEIESASEQTATLVIGSVIALIALALVGAGLVADPIQTTDAGSKIF